MLPDPSAAAPPSAMSCRDPRADLTSALDAAACLGSWAHDPAADRVVVAPPLGERLGLAPQEHAGAPLARILSALHPEDRPRIEAMLDAVWQAGGPFEAEFRARVGRSTRILRWTGRREPAGDRPRLHGLAFDLSELRAGCGDPPLQAQWQVNQLAGHVIAMQALAAGLESPALSRLIDRMAVETGFELARRLGQPGGTPH